MPTLTIDPNLRGILANMVWRENAAKIVAKLDRPTYVKINKILECLGGKWDRSLQAHIFEGEAREAVEDAAETGTYIDWKRQNEFFETPEPLARRMLDLADVAPDFTVLEPSAGKGAIVKPALQFGATVLAVEQFEPYAKVIAGLAPDGFDRLKVAVLDFLAFKPTPVFDAVVMNPPFKNDVYHVAYAARFLRPGGKLVSVMGPGWTFRTSAISERFRYWVTTMGAKWEKLPEKSFSSSGTYVHSGLLTMQRADP